MMEPSHPSQYQRSSGAFQQGVRGNYIRTALTTGEGLICEAKVNFLKFVPLLLIAIVCTFTVALAIIGIPLLIYVIFACRSIELAVTNKRLIAKFGIVRRSTIEMNLNRVESVQVHQSVLGRLFNYGSLVVSGAGTPQVPIPGINDPMTFRRIVLEAQEAISTGPSLPGIALRRPA
jgi:membrane protein YdbS with pleckstrin-like domain